MGGPDYTVPHRQRATAYRLDVEQLKGHAASDDVQDRVESTDLVERHLLRGEPMNPALGLGEEAESGDGTARDPLRQARALDELSYVREGAVRMLLGVLYGEPERSNTVNLRGLHPKLERESELSEYPFELLGRDPRVEQRGEGHIASGAADGLEVRVLGEGPLSPRRGGPR